MTTSEEKALARASAKEAKAASRQLAADAKSATVAERQAEIAATLQRVGKLVRKNYKMVGFSLYIYENEIWVGNPESRGARGWPIAGAQAEAIVNGQVTQRLTATRMVALGVFALAAPKKTGNQTLSLKVRGPGYNFTYQHQGDVTRLAIQTFEGLADTINTLAGHDMSAANGQPAVAPSAADEIAKFAALRDQGILSEDEFTAKKAQLLA